MPITSASSRAISLDSTGYRFVEHQSTPGLPSGVGWLLKRSNKTFHVNTFSVLRWSIVFFYTTFWCWCCWWCWCYFCYFAVFYIYARSLSRSGENGKCMIGYQANVLDSNTHGPSVETLIDILTPATALRVRRIYFAHPHTPTSTYCMRQLLLRSFCNQQYDGARQSARCGCYGLA